MFCHENRCLDSSVELGTSLKLSCLLSRDCDLSLGCGVDALTSSTLSNRECTKTYESNLVTSLQSFGNRCNNCVNSLLGVNFAQPCFCSNCSYEFAFVHKLEVFKVNIKKSDFECLSLYL